MLLGVTDSNKHTNDVCKTVLFYTFMLILCKFLMPIPDVLTDHNFQEKKCGLYAGTHMVL